MADGCVYGKELTVESRITGLCWRKTAGKESQGLPSLVHKLLKDGIGGEGQGGFTSWVVKKSGIGLGGLGGVESGGHGIGPS